MKKLVAIYTKDLYSPVSWAIRIALPRSIFCVAKSSHVLIVDPTSPDYVYSAGLIKGVERLPIEVAMKGLTVVDQCNYEVPDIDACSDWLLQQVGKKYDLKGAVGIGIAPDRDWNEDDMWYCYELLAAAIVAGGRNVFRNLSHINETALLAIT